MKKQSHMGYKNPLEVTVTLTDNTLLYTVMETVTYSIEESSLCQSNYKYNKLHTGIPCE